MEIELLIKSILGLVAILAVLIFLLLSSSSKKRRKKEEKLKILEKSAKLAVKKPLNTDMKYLYSIIKNKKTKASKLQETLDLIIKHHGRIHPKLGTRPHKDFDIYGITIFTICRHPNANKEMIVKFDRELVNLNENYMQDINEFLTKGLNSRRV